MIRRPGVDLDPVFFLDKFPGLGGQADTDKEYADECKDS
jgi:hypothetical protein